jgi:hypothetical protein
MPVYSERQYGEDFKKGEFIHMYGKKKSGLRMDYPRCQRKRPAEQNADLLDSAVTNKYGVVIACFPADDLMEKSNRGIIICTWYSLTLDTAARDLRSFRLAY